LLLSDQVTRLLGARKRTGEAAPDRSFPLIGDLLMQVVLDPSVYTLTDDTERCRGTVTLALFDTVCWRRFDIRSLTTMSRVETALQLAGVERWLRTIAASKAGQVCRASSSPGATVYGLAVTETGPDHAAARHG
ncbi:MAG TPA: hypothetical protein VEB22_08120, partial [Phycisphaerales bacterium]|nr:hypothetical protein [Phycisphaerales bacterium]